MNDDDMKPCPICGEDMAHVVNGTTYSKATLVEIQGVYDGGLFFAHTTQSGGCGGAWHRWTDERMRNKAQPYMDRWNQKRLEANIQNQK